MWHRDRSWTLWRGQSSKQWHTTEWHPSLSFTLSVSQIRVHPSFVVFHCSGESGTNTQHTPVSMLCSHRRSQSVTGHVTHNMLSEIRRNGCLHHSLSFRCWMSPVPMIGDGTRIFKTWPLNPAHWDTRAGRSSSSKQMQAPPNSTRQISQSI